MELFLLRHGIPVDPDLWNDSDRTRPLTDEGVAQLIKISHALRPHIRPDDIWSSPYLRTHQTAQLISQTLGIQFSTIESLRSGSHLIQSIPKQQGHPSTWPERLLLVGHQPDLGGLAAELSGTSSLFHFDRAGMACLRGEFRPGGMKIEWLLSPDELLNKFS